MSAAAAIPAEPVLAGAPVAYAAATASMPTVTYAAAPMTMPAVAYAAAPTMTYAAPQPEAYYVAGQTAGGSMAAPLAASATVPVAYAAPTTYNISAERFAQIAAGIPLTQEEINAMLSGSAAPEPALMVETAAPLVSAAAGPVVSAAAAAAPVTSAAAMAEPLVASAKASKKKSSKKALKSSKKKKAGGCC